MNRTVLYTTVFGRCQMFVSDFLQRSLCAMFSWVLSGTLVSFVSKIFKCNHGIGFMKATIIQYPPSHLQDYSPCNRFPVNVLSNFLSFPFFPSKKNLLSFNICLLLSKCWFNVCLLISLVSVLNDSWSSKSNETRFLHYFTFTSLYQVYHFFSRQQGRSGARPFEGRRARGLEGRGRRVEVRKSLASWPPAPGKELGGYLSYTPSHLVNVE